MESTRPEALSSLTFVKGKPDFTGPVEIQYDNWIEDIVQHEDHWDSWDDRNVYDDEMYSLYDDLLRDDPDCRTYFTHDQLWERQKVHDWIRKLANVRKGGYIPLDSYSKGFCPIPLFVDDAGEQYSLGLGIGFTGRPFIPQATCPLIVPDDLTEIAVGLFELQCRIPVSAADRDRISLPKFAITLGQLYVTTSRHPWRAVRQTDYSVVMDVDREEMPLWIIAHREQMHNPANAPERLFDGLLEDGRTPYDAACIMRSVRQLGALSSGSDAPRYRDSYDLVNKTRAHIDPIASLQLRSKLLEYTTEDHIPGKDDWKNELNRSA